MSRAELEVKITHLVGENKQLREELAAHLVGKTNIINFHVPRKFVTSQAKFAHFCQKQINKKLRKTRVQNVIKTHLVEFSLLLFSSVTKVFFGRLIKTDHCFLFLFFNSR